MKNKFLELKSVTDQAGNPYYFSHETRCAGKIVAVLPVRVTETGIQFLLRKELTPAWNGGSDRVFINAITGGMETKFSDSILVNLDYTVINELKEEAGYEVTADELYRLGVVRAGKSCDSVYFLYTVDLTNKEQQLPEPDSKLEEMETVFWSDTVYKSDDFLPYVMYQKMVHLGSKVHIKS